LPIAYFAQQARERLRLGRAIIGLALAGTFAESEEFTETEE
jgi:hypothetical protein